MSDDKLRNIRAMMSDVASEAVKSSDESRKAELDTRFQKLNDDFDKRFGDLQKAIAQSAKGGNPGNEKLDAFKKGFQEYIRKGHFPADIVAKADGYVRFDGATAGNLLMPDEISSYINRKLLEISPVLQVVDVQNITSPVFDQPVQTDNLDTYWESEDAQSTLSKDQFKLVKLTPFELRGRVYFTQSMLDDAAYDLEGYTTESITLKMAQKIGTAVLSGDGFQKPAGMNTGLESINSAALALAWNDIVRLEAAPKIEYLGEDATTGFMMTRKTRAAVRLLALTNGNQYTWETDGRAGYPERLLGRRVFIAAEGDLASTTDAGAFTSGQVGILFGNFRRAYTVALKDGIYVIRDIYSGSDRFRVFLNVMRRVDGRVTQSEAAYRLVAAGS